MNHLNPQLIQINTFRKDIFLEANTNDRNSEFLYFREFFVLDWSLDS